MRRIGPALRHRSDGSTHLVGFDGSHYEIDLTEVNSHKLHEAFSDYLAAAPHSLCPQQSRSAYVLNREGQKQPRRAGKDSRMGCCKRP